VGRRQGSENWNLALIPLLLGTALTLSGLLSACGSEARGQAQASAERWELKGPLMAWDGSAWIVDGVPIIVPTELGVDEQRALGAQVAAAGRFDTAGRRITSAIILSSGTLPESTLPAAQTSGTITAIDGTVWTVAGSKVIVAAGTRIEAADPDADANALVAVGSVAEIEGYASDAGLIATQVTLTAPDAFRALPAPASDTASDEFPTGTAVDAGTESATPAPAKQVPAGDDAGGGAGADPERGKDLHKHDAHDKPHDDGHKQKKKSELEGLMGSGGTHPTEWSTAA